MAETENRSVLEETLKPFYQRASEAEERLSRLEAALASKKRSGNEDHSELISVLQSKLNDAYAEVALEQEKNKKLTTENGKLQYRILHLIRAIDGDDKLEKKTEKLTTETEKPPIPHTPS